MGWGLLLLFLASVLDPSAQAAPRWVGTWSAPPRAESVDEQGRPDPSLMLSADSTLRQIFRISLGGTRLRVQLSNAYGRVPLVVDGVAIAPRVTAGPARGGVESARGTRGLNSAINPTLSRPVRFGGETSITLAPGESRWSDAVELEVAALEEVALSLYFQAPVDGLTSHGSDQPAYLCRGNRLSNESCDDVPMLPTWLFFTAAQVESAEAGATALAAFGDSITDGFGPDLRWTDWLARDFARARRPMGLVNAGIAGNRLLRNTGGDQYYNEGASALSRFERDVLAQPGVTGVVVLLGVNDIGQPGATTDPSEGVRPEELIAGYRQLIAAAHSRGMKIWGGTLLPFQGAYLGSYWSPEKERVRLAVNRWIREGGEWDGVIDFDGLMRDPRQPARLRAAYDGGDHLHPGQAGFRAMAKAVGAEVEKR